MDFKIGPETSTYVNYFTETSCDFLIFPSSPSSLIPVSLDQLIKAMPIIEPNKFLGKDDMSDEIDSKASMAAK